MKQVKLVFKKNGICHILAHGTFGAGTAKFTMELANLLGEIIERHQGRWHAHSGLDLETETQEINETKVCQKLKSSQ